MVIKRIVPSLYIFITFAAQNRYGNYRMSIRNVDLNSEEWCDLVFEDRNKEYGAYYLRKTSTRRHLFALSIVIAATILIIIFSKIIHLDWAQQIRDNEYEVKPIELSNLIWLEENKNNPVKVDEKPKLEDIAKFTPPIITEDENIAEDIEKLQDISLVPDSTDVFLDLDENTLLLHQKIAEWNQEDEQNVAASNEKNRNAQFQDGKTALLRYIYQNIHYPPEALKQRIYGRVICSFIVNEDGSLSDVALAQGVYVSLDEEVIRVVNSMPLWNPALKDGKPVKVKYIMPVVFRLN